MLIDLLKGIQLLCNVQFYNIKVDQILKKRRRLHLFHLHQKILKDMDGLSHRYERFAFGRIKNILNCKTLGKLCVFLLLSKVRIGEHFVWVGWVPQWDDQGKIKYLPLIIDFCVSESQLDFEASTCLNFQLAINM